MPRTRALNPRPPTTGKGSHEVRGTAAQRRAFYESFREHTQETLATLLGIMRDEEADNGHRIQAAKEILARGWGGVPQVQVIEAALKHEHSISRDALKGLSPTDLRALELALTKLVDVPDAEVIEASPVEDDED